MRDVCACFADARQAKTSGKKKVKKKKKRAGEEGDRASAKGGDDGFRVDVSTDKRFDAILRSNEYAIDPNDSRYEDTPARPRSPYSMRLCGACPESAPAASLGRPSRVTFQTRPPRMQGTRRALTHTKTPHVRLRARVCVSGFALCRRPCARS